MDAVRTYHIHSNIVEAEAAVRTALKARGFGILTEVDVKATLKEKLGVDVPPYRILGACNPSLAHASLQAEPAVGAFLPCGVALSENAAGTETTVFMQNSLAMADMFAAPGLEGPATEAAVLLDAALSSVAEPSLTSSPAGG